MQSDNIVFQTEAITVKIVARTCGNRTVPVIWSGLTCLPSMDELTHWLESLVMCGTSELCSNFILYFEHTGATKLQQPDLEMVKTFVGVLVKHRPVLKQKLVCSVYQAKELDIPTMMFRDLLLTMYTPVKPLLITDDLEDINEFIAENGPRP